MKRALVFSLMVVSAASFAGCRSTPPDKDYDAKLPPGQLALRKITDPAQIPNFTDACRFVSGLDQSIQNSLSYLSKPSSQKAFPYGEITHENAVKSLQAFTELLHSGKTSAEMNRELREKFDVYISVGCDNQGTVLYTGYYTPIFDGSPVQTPKFNCPLYKKPPELANKGQADFMAPTLPDRRTIEESKMYAGNEIAWVSDPFEAYVVQVQGSAKLRMPDGQLMTIGYTADNGREYKSVREELVNAGKIGKYDRLPAMIRFFKANPKLVQEYTWRNPRYVFFDIVPDGRPRGCLNEPVTEMRTIATDKKVFPPGCLAFIAARVPQDVMGKVRDLPYTGFALDQDRGGAIQAAGRCDLYMGVGDKAGQLAGSAKNEGKLYYLFLKSAAPAVKADAPETAPAEPGQPGLPDVKAVPPAKAPSPKPPKDPRS